MELDNTIGYQIKSVWHSISKMYNDFAEDHQLTFTMALVLLSLDRVEGMPSTHIGPTVGLEPRSLTRLLKRMEDDGLIIKKQSKEDKRQVFICLTDKGILKQETADKKISNFNEEVKSTFSQDEMDTFLNVLKKVKKIAKQNIQK